MMAKQTRELPPGLINAKERFDAWRRSRPLGTRIPRRLWTLATKQAQVHGLCKTASVLGLDYYSLKKRVQAESPAVPHSGFVEVNAAVIEPPGQCLIELEEADGAKMRVRLSGGTVPDLTTLVRSFRSGQ
jgi:hypothetical protein